MALSAPRREEFELVLLGVDLPFQGEIPSLGDAERLQNAHRGCLGGLVFADDLTDGELQRQAVFALLLVGYVAQQAADGEWIACLLALAQVQLEFHRAAVMGVKTQRRALNLLTVQGTAEKGCHLGAATRPEQFLECIERQKFRIVEAEASLPGGIGVEESPRRAERGNHLAGAFK
jgi:hypothetical protein